MRKTLHISDLHLGVQRTGGTTNASASALTQWALEQYSILLNLAVAQGCKRVIVNGDLTDQYDIPLSIALDILARTRQFMDANHDIEMIWSRGNHDLAKDSSRLGIVTFLGTVLEGWFPGRFILCTWYGMLGDGIFIVPHLVNQEQFDLALTRVPEGTKYLLLHCNYDNTFAGAMDHSLNVSRAQVREFRDRGITVILAHEHQHRTMFKGGLIIVGNQFPTSVSDCLAHGDGQKDGKKYALVIGEAGTEMVQTWSTDQADGWFAEADWQELADLNEDGRGFIRVTGEAAATQAAEVIKALSTFRQRSKSFVVTNAVKVEGVEGKDEELVTQEDIRQIDVIALLLELLEPAQADKVRELTGRIETKHEEDAVEEEGVT